MGSPRAAMSGKYEGEGMWIPWPCPPCSCASVGACSSSGSACPFDPPATTGTNSPSGPSAYLVCQWASSADTKGISSKLWGGGGDGVDHSSVRASQGSG